MPEVTQVRGRGSEDWYSASWIFVVQGQLMLDAGAATGELWQQRILGGTTDLRHSSVDAPTPPLGAVLAHLLRRLLSQTSAGHEILVDNQ